ncbi:universal stress protein [Salinibacter sp.]|uniref:universal stress protein n=1 Tax=Salinibacter sp. TaxID=2065818 RepID=UPI0021E955BB|nr:universal stress protein [Salinibacter sp.]
MPHRILVPTDFSPSAEAALAHAVSLADRFGAPLHLLHVVHQTNTDLYGLGTAEAHTDRLREEAEASARAQLAELAPERASQEVHTAVAQDPDGSVAGAIEEYVLDSEIDLVVMGTHGRRGLGRLVLGSVANRLVRREVVPVLTVRRGENGATPPVAYDNVLAPIDFSDHSKTALRRSKEVASRCGATQHLLFVAETRVQPTFSDTGIPGVSVVEMDPEIVANAEEALDELNASVGGPGVPTACHVEAGGVAQTIVDVADAREADLIVMATRGLTGIDRFVLGGNTERVLRTAPCPVLAVPASVDGAPNA